MPSKSLWVTSLADLSRLTAPTCGDCKKVLKSVKLLRRHQAIVHGKGKFSQCDTCGVRFTSWSALQEHEKAVHFKQKPNRCPDCGKCFTRNRDVKRHQMNVHLQKRVNQCDKVFSRKTDLVEHKQIHDSMDCKGDQPLKRVSSQQAQETTAPAPVTDKVTSPVKSAVDELVLASEIFAGMVLMWK